MDLGLFTDSVADLSLEAALDLAQQIGCQSVELATGGQSSSPHLDLEVLLKSGKARDRLLGLCEDRGVRIAALNCSAWPMHPIVGPLHADLMRSTIQLAELLDVKTIVTMSGTPGDGPAARTFNWIWFPWPADAVQILETQWQEAIAFWQGMASYAIGHGVERIALELHPLHLVYNVPTLERLRRNVGPIIGANLDPSHLLWQGMDPIQVVQSLGRAIHHVHLKDTEIFPERVATAGLLDQTGMDDPSHRAWVFRAVGLVDRGDFWPRFIRTLRDEAFAGSLSIENEDPDLPSSQGVEAAATYIRPLLQSLRRVGAPAPAVGGTGS